jgi:hypothetical protein
MGYIQRNLEIFMGAKGWAYLEDAARACRLVLGRRQIRSLGSCLFRIYWKKISFWGRKVDLLCHWEGFVVFLVFDY